MLNQQCAGQHELRELGVAEFVEEAEKVAVERLYPEALAGAEVATDERGGDARVDGGGVEGEQAAFAPAEDADGGGGVAVLALEPVDGGKDFLDLVTDRVAAEHE